MAITPNALTAERRNKVEKGRLFQFVLKQSQTAFKGGVAMVKKSDGKCYAAQQDGYEAGVVIGLFAETKTNTTADDTVTVDLLKDMNLVWLDNATGGDAVVQADLLSTCYMVDDHTVTITSASGSQAGIVWGVSSDGKTVLVEIAPAAMAALVEADSH